MPKFLTPEWRDHLWDVVRTDGTLLNSTQGVSLTLQQVVRDVPGVGDSRYWVRVADGVIDGGPGDADATDVTVIQTYDTALALFRGELDPEAAFVRGLVEVKGDFKKLTKHASVVSAIASAARSIPTEF